MPENPITIIMADPLLDNENNLPMNKTLAQDEPNLDVEGQAAIASAMALVFLQLDERQLPQVNLDLYPCET